MLDRFLSDLREPVDLLPLATKPIAVPVGNFRLAQVARPAAVAPRVSKPWRTRTPCGRTGLGWRLVDGTRAARLARHALDLERRKGGVPEATIARMLRSSPSLGGTPGQPVATPFLWPTWLITTS